MTYFTKYFRIAKMDEAKQSVWGYASTPTLDSDEEIVSLDAIKAALPGYLEWGNIREMHKSSAVGVAIEDDTHVDDKGLWLGARIVDPMAWLKVKEEVYKGFSIGGNVVRKKGNVIEQLELVEISLVDRPANADCRIEIIKAAKSATDTISLLRVDESAESFSAEEMPLVKKFISFLRGMVKSGGHPGSMDLENIPGDGHAPGNMGEFPGIPSTGPTDENKHSPSEIKDGSKPYGDVTYADPGYQSDGKHRYPIDTPRHIRSAWGYIHKPENRIAYTEEQVSHIENAIVSAWKEHIDPEGPSAEKSIKVDDDDDLVMLLVDAYGGDPEVIHKGMHGVGRLSMAFEDIREVQRRHLYEAHIEGGDTDDIKVAEDLGDIANQISEIIGRIAAHEGAEGVTLTDMDDVLWTPPFSYGNPNGGNPPPFSLSTTETAKMTTPNMLKRSSKAAHAAKAMHHIGEAMKCHKAMHASIRALHDLNMAHAKSAKSAKDGEITKAADFPGAEAMTHTHNILAQHLKMADHHDMAHSHMMLCAGEHLGPGDSGDGWEAPSGTTDLPSNGHTEGHVPGLNDGTGPTKGASAELIKALTEAAYLKGKVEALEQMPAARGGAVPAMFDFGKMVGDGQNGSTVDTSALLKGVNLGATDQGESARNAGRMIGNMLTNPGMFGKNPVTDPNFRGGAG